MKKENQLQINKAINYIVSNMTHAPDLDKVASIAGFSKYHFHRIFKELTGETLALFTKRIRLEHAAFLLLFYKHRSITDIALSCGYHSSQSFSTAFKKYYKVTPKVYKQNIGCQGIIVLDNETIASYEVSIQFIDSFNVAYERSFGEYSDEALDLQRIKVLERYPDKTFIGISWDNPEVTPEGLCRFDYGYIVKDRSEAPNCLIQNIEAKTYAKLSVDIKEVNTIAIWEYLYVEWLPRHGYKPDALFCFEKIKANASMSSSDTTFIEFFLPIKKI